MGESESENGGSGGYSEEWVYAKMRIYFHARCG